MGNCSFPGKGEGVEIVHAEVSSFVANKSTKALRFQKVARN